MGLTDGRQVVGTIVVGLRVDLVGTRVLGLYDGEYELGFAVGFLVVGERETEGTAVDRVGALVGAEDGLGDGFTDGGQVGAQVGDMVGGMVGDTEGPTDGLCDGM